VKKKDRYHHGALRQALMDEALQVLEKEGLEAMSLRGLAASAGVSKTAPYRHFADKRELLMTLAAEGFGNLADALEASQAGDGKGSADAATGEAVPREAVTAGIRALSRAYLRFAVARPALYRLMFSRLGFSLHSEKCRINSERALACLVKAVEQARSRGWRANQESGSLITSLWAEVHGLAGLIIEGLLPEGFDKSPQSLEKAVEALL
jgi:AcrR family transcriptional regulator